ncbi:hypothetical protein M9H77_22864 [Catharanthus roseus]|uniref:Uncharacterized protein n=1 Tax=Catharanthus roseus TaxID=4058 RepID=A0ACC0AVP6_CATRO|nr:hypothetical protein M9H77_22864 [Catharanthus roseus]
MAHPSHRWKYREGTLMEGPSRTTSLSSYSLMEIVPEREPVPMIDLSDSESVKGLIAQEVEFGASIKEDPSEVESESDAEMIPEPEGVAPADAEGTGTFTVGGSPWSVSPICGYCLWREQRAEDASQQVVQLREEISRMDDLFYAAYQARRQETARATMLKRELAQMWEAHAAREREREISKLIHERD